MAEQSIRPKVFFIILIFIHPLQQVTHLNKHTHTQGNTNTNTHTHTHTHTHTDISTSRINSWLFIVSELISDSGCCLYYLVVLLPLCVGPVLPLVLPRSPERKCWRWRSDGCCSQRHEGSDWETVRKRRRQKCLLRNQQQVKEYLSMLDMQKQTSCSAPKSRELN